MSSLKANQNGETSDGTGGLLGALGEVVGEWLQGWGLLGALRKRSGAPGVARSTPATPPTHSHPSSPSHEHIELRQLSFQVCLFYIYLYLCGIFDVILF